MKSFFARRSPQGAWSHDVRRRAAWIALASLAMLFFLALPFFAGRVYTDDDLGEFHLPLRAFYADRLAAGASFDWMPSLYCGFFVTGEGQLGGYHPWRQFLYSALPLGAAFDWELLASYPLMWLGAYLFFQRLLRRPDAALFGAMTFTFSGFCLLHFAHPNAIAVVAHTPWLLWAIDLVVRPRSPRQRTLALVAIALLTGSQCLLGYPQYVWFSLLAESALLVWRLIGFLPRESAEESAAAIKTGLCTPRRAAPPDDSAGPIQTSIAALRRLGRDPRLPAMIHLAAWVLAAKACGALLGAQQLLPTIWALRDSVRATPDVALSNYGSLHPLNLIQFFAPYLFQTRVIGQNTRELGLYCGVVPLLLCAWLWNERAQWGRAAPLARAGFALALVALLLAMGEHAGLYELQRYVPVANHFRFPCRAIVLVHLAIALLSAVAWRRLIDATRSRTLNVSRLRSLLSNLCALSLGIALAGPLCWPEFTASPWLVCVGPVSMVAASALVACAARGNQLAWRMLPALAALDLGCYGLTAGVYRETANLQSYVVSSPAPPATAGRVVSGRDIQNRRYGDRLLLAGFDRADGYAGLEPRRRLDYRAANVQRVAGVTYFRRPTPIEGESPWQQAERPLPRARLITRLAPAITPALDSFDVERAAAVDRPVELDPRPVGKAQVVVDQPGRIVVNTVATGRQLLAVSEAYDSGWEALIDGRPATPVRINGDFLGVVAPVGRHRVELRFAPISVAYGRLAAGLGVGLLVVSLALAWQAGELRGRPPRATTAHATPRDPADPAGAGAGRGSNSAAVIDYLDESLFERIPKL